MVQQQQSVPRFGGIGAELVTPLPGNHGHLSVRSEIRSQSRNWRAALSQVQLREDDEATLGLNSLGSEPSEHPGLGK